jgi:hypothetical protein
LGKGKGEVAARLAGIFDNDEAKTGDYMDALGNIFKSRKYDGKEAKRI